MASTLFALPFVGYQPADIVNGQPAIDAANLTKQTMLGPPFAWPWNRGNFEVGLVDSINGVTIVPEQDYYLTSDDIPQYGFLERVWLRAINDPGLKVMELKVVLSLAEEDAQMRPQSVAAQTVDENDNVLLRFNARPDQAYLGRGCYQAAAGVITSMASLWKPIPDHLSYIYDWGYMSFLALLVRDPRSAIYSQRFAAHLLGAQDGLTATQRNIFLANFLTLMGEQQRTPQMQAQGVSARQV
jgi:hypothetical protein